MTWPPSISLGNVGGIRVDDGEFLLFDDPGYGHGSAMVDDVGVQGCQCGCPNDGGWNWLWCTV